MKKIFFTCLAFCFAWQAYTQTEFAPIGAEWYYNNYWSNYDYFDYIVVEKDTIIEGNNCRVLKQYPTNSTTASETYIIKQEQNKIYHYYHNRFNLLFDFDAKVGDVVEFSFMYKAYKSVLAARYRVESITTNAQNLKTFTTKLIDSDFSEYGYLYAYINDTTTIIRTEDRKQLVSNDENLNDALRNFNVFSFTYPFPYSMNEYLKRIVTMECNCNVKELAEFLEENYSIYFSDIEHRQQKPFVPNNYTYTEKTGGNYTFMPILSDDIILGEVWQFLRCYSDDDFSFISPSWEATSLPCDYSYATSVEILQDKNLTIYPNPFNETVFVSANNGGNIEIRDVSGTIIHYSEVLIGKNEISTSHFRKGIYMVKIQNKDNSVQNFKIVKL